MLKALLIPLALATIVYAVTLLRAALARRSAPRLEAVALGAITNFFDTLGIGSFAPTMAWFKFRRLVPDRLIPCTMIVGHTLPTMARSFSYSSAFWSTRSRRSWPRSCATFPACATWCR